MDSNADTCCLGTNFVILEYTQRVAEVYAYDKDLPPTTVPIVSGATAFDCPLTGTTYIIVVNEALYYGERLDHSLFNPNQIRQYGIPLWDNPFDPAHELGIELHETHVPLSTKGTKLYFTSRAPTDRELNTCHHIHLTSKMPWDPGTVQLGELSSESLDARQNPNIHDPRSNDFEMNCLDPIWHNIATKRVVSQLDTPTEDARFADLPSPPTFVSTQRHSKATAENLSERLGISVDRARATLRATLQRGTRSAILPLARRYRADRQFDRPVLNHKFSTDTGYFKHRSLRGNIASQIYFHKCGFYVCHHLPKVDDKNVGPSLTSFIADWGIPKHLTMDGAAVQVGRNTTFMNTIRRAGIKYHISAPRKPNENPAEGGIRELKRRFYRLVIKHSIPMRLWDFVLDYVVDTMNLTVNYSRYSDGRVPLEIITGITPDITEYLDFTIYGWVYFRADGQLGENEIGRWLGVSHRVGPAMTYWILPKSGRPISCDTVQNVTEADKQKPNVMRQMDEWEKAVGHLWDSKSGEWNWAKNVSEEDLMFDLESEDEEFMRNFSMLINPETLVDGDLEGTTRATDDLDAQNYVNMEVGLPRGPDGQLQKAVVKKRIVDENGRPVGIANNNQLLDTRQYEVEYEDGGTEILAANYLAENLLAQVDEHGHRHRMMEEISDHRTNDRAVKKSDGYIVLGSGQTRQRRTTAGWELHVIWKDGSSNWITLKDMKESFPIEVADYARSRGIADEPAFAWWVPHVEAKRKHFIGKVKSKYWERTHKYGIRIPKSVKEAIEIDKENGDTLWRDAIQMEMKNNRVAFEKYAGDVSKLIGYKKITAHLIFDVKLGENFRRKARFVADGHKTEAPAALTYSTVVSRDSVRILLMVAALNGLDVQCADIQNAFLTAPNLERCYMVAGPEFGEEEGETFIVRRALYGLKSASAAFRSHLSSTLMDLGFLPSYADPDVYMRPAVKTTGEEYYEYILCYVDDILCMSMEAKAVMNRISEKFKFKKDKIEEPVSYLGAGLKKKLVDNEDEIWAMSSYEYVKAAVKNVEETVKSNPRWKLPVKAPTPMMTDYEPEMDGSEVLSDEDRTYYQELIGILRWATEIGRVDILLEVSLLSQYQAEPRTGHMEQLLRIFAFLKKHPKLSLYFDWRLPNIDFSKVQSPYEDFRKYYPDAKEELPHNMPKARGLWVQILAYVDASHAANKKTRKSHTGYIIFMNSAPIVWHSKRQNTVEASTFGSEFIALKSCIESITHLRYKLRMFGVPLSDEPARILCDNESVVKNSSHVESTLNKKHNSIAYHYTRWNVAARAIEVAWINGMDNLADAFTKRLTQLRRMNLFGAWTY